MMYLEYHRITNTLKNYEYSLMSSNVTKYLTALEHRYILGTDSKARNFGDSSSSSWLADKNMNSGISKAKWLRKFARNTVKRAGDCFERKTWITPDVENEFKMYVVFER